MKMLDLHYGVELPAGLGVVDHIPAISHPSLQDRFFVNSTEGLWNSSLVRPAAKLDLVAFMPTCSLVGLDDFSFPETGSLTDLSIMVAFIWSLHRLQEVYK